MNIVELEQTCGACPAQWEGRIDDGRHIYIRARHGDLSVSVGRTLDEAVDASMFESNPDGADVLLRAEDPTGGWLPQEDMLAILAADGLHMAVTS